MGRNPRHGPTVHGERKTTLQITSKAIHVMNKNTKMVNRLILKGSPPEFKQPIDLSGNIYGMVKPICVNESYYKYYQTAPAPDNR